MKSKSYVIITFGIYVRIKGQNSRQEVTLDLRQEAT